MSQAVLERAAGHQKNDTHDYEERKHFSPPNPLV
jgi:hypothetical protein